MVLQPFLAHLLWHNKMLNMGIYALGLRGVKV
jgi:hypothetical protein